MHPSISIYVLMYSLMYGGALFQCISIRWRRVAAFVSILAIAPIIILRGNVGTDTVAYESIVKDIISGEININLEPGFHIIVGALGSFSSSPAFVVRCMTAIYIIMILIFISITNRNNLFVLMTYFAPSFLLQQSMNALRIGLATALFLMLLDFSSRNRAINKVAGFAPLSVHYSAVLMPVMLLLSRYAASAFKVPALALTFAVAGMIMAVQKREYLASKIELYSHMQSPSWTSGIIPLLTGVILLACTAPAIRHRRYKRRYIAIALLSVCASFVLSRWSYAGLRTLELVLSVFPFIFTAVLTASRSPMSKLAKFGIFTCGIINSAAFMRRIIFDPGSGKSPWMPFTFLD